MRVRYLLPAALLVAAPAAWAQTPSHDYELNGSYVDSMGGPSLTAIGSPTQTMAGVNFGGGSGLALTNTAFASSTTYSIAFDLQVDSASGSFGYGRIFGVNGNGSALYTYAGPGVTYYEGGNQGFAAMSFGTPHQLLVTRDSSTLAVYIDGAPGFSIASTASSSLTGPLQFFFDPSGENVSGFVDRIRTFDTALDASQAAALFAAPEPAGWAMMIAGFGAAGTALRRRRRRTALMS